MLHRIALVTICLTVTVWGCSGGGGNGSLTHDPAVPTADGQAAVPFQVRIETTKGELVLLVHPEWAQRGAARFRELVEDKYYDGCAFFRVIDGFMAQTGVNSNRDMSEKWMHADMPDDPVTQSNRRGTVTFAMAGPNTRTTQIFFSYSDNSFLDGQGFSPFAEVVSGMEVLDALNGEYGDMPSQGGNGPDPGRIVNDGDSYLKSSFPNLDYIQTARIIDTADSASAEETPATDVPVDVAPATESGATEPPASDQPATDSTANP